jgi:hypothetical protein
MLTNAEESKDAKCLKLSKKNAFCGAKYIILSQDGKDHVHEMEITICEGCSGPLINASVRYLWKLLGYKNYSSLKKDPRFLEIINEFKEHGVLNLSSYESECPQDIISNISIFLQGVGKLSLEELQVIVDLTDRAHSWEIHDLVELIGFREWLLN